MGKYKIIVSCFCSEVIVTLVTMLKNSNKNLEIIAGFLEKGASISNQATELHWLQHGNEANAENSIFSEADAIVCLLDSNHIAELMQLAERYNKPLIICGSTDSGAKTIGKHVHVMYCDYHDLDETLLQLTACIATPS